MPENSIKGKVLMKHFLIILMFLSTSCELFQSQQQAGESVTTEAKPEEVFVPVEKELTVCNYSYSYGICKT